MLSHAAYSVAASRHLAWRSSFEVIADATAHVVGAPNIRAAGHPARVGVLAAASAVLLPLSFLKAAQLEFTSTVAILVNLCAGAGSGNAMDDQNYST